MIPLALIEGWYVHLPIGCSADSMLDVDKPFDIFFGFINGFFIWLGPISVHSKIPVKHLIVDDVGTPEISPHDVISDPPHRSQSTPPSSRTMCSLPPIQRMCKPHSCLPTSFCDAGNLSHERGGGEAVSDTKIAVRFIMQGKWIFQLVFIGTVCSKQESGNQSPSSCLLQTVQKALRRLRYSNPTVDSALSTRVPRTKARTDPVAS